MVPWISQVDDATDDVEDTRLGGSGLLLPRLKMFGMRSLGFFLPVPVCFLGVPVGVVDLSIGNVLCLDVGLTGVSLFEVSDMVRVLAVVVMQGCD